MFSIKDVYLTSKNPQSNAICERMHQTVSNVLQTLVHTYPSQNMTQTRGIVDDALATAMYAKKDDSWTPSLDGEDCECDEDEEDLDNCKTCSESSHEAKWTIKQNSIADTYCGI